MTEFYSNLAISTLTLAATLAAAVIMLCYYRRAAETMLFIPWAWALGTFGLVTALSCFGEFSGHNRFGLFPGNYGASFFVAACGTLCPFVALIGAKRPQHSAWSFVVLALWGMLALPAAEVILLNPGQGLEINSIRSWFLLVLILAGLCNFVLTRYGISSVLLAIAQFIWLGPWLPWSFHPLLMSREFGGLLCASLAVVVAWFVSRSHTRAPNDYDRLWFDFRDTFGLFWSLRLIERVNDTANTAGWDFDLGWGGFRTKSDFEPLAKLPPEVDRALRNCLEGSLRRFVSSEWISERLRAADSAD